MLTVLFPRPAHLSAAPAFVGIVRRAATAALACAALLAPQPAWAGSANVSCVRSHGMLNCAAQWGEGGGFPRVIALDTDRDERAAAAGAERDRQWAARCKPRLRTDRYGVGRYTYAAPGCEFGRSED
jgi:hypothetical protein